MKAKNPHAVALGRKGGKKTGRKGFAALTPEDGKRIRKLAAIAKGAKFVMKGSKMFRVSDGKEVTLRDVLGLNV